MKSIFSVDVEDWFHILDVPSTPELSRWDALPSRLEKNLLKLLELFGAHEVRVTFFFLGWVARRFPHLVREADRCGHEIASHGYAHRLAYQMTPQEFYKDALMSKMIIEDTVGKRVLGYRSSGFSVTKKALWFFDKLAEAGYRYDSSVFPGSHGHGGLKGGPCAPYQVGQDLIEFPITVAKVLGTRICFFGGGYLRLFPLHVIQRMARKVLREERPVIFYIHPREIDPDHPRLAMNPIRRFKSYVNLRTSEAKLHSLLGAFEFTTFQDFMATELKHFEPAARPAAAALNPAVAVGRGVGLEGTWR